MELQVTFYQRIEEIQKKLREANYQCNQLRTLVDDLGTQTIAPPLIEQKPVVPPAPKLADEPVSPPASVQAPTPVTPPAQRQGPPPPPPRKPVHPAPDRQSQKRPTRPPVRPKSQPKREKKPSKMKRDWEKFIGENLINKIGIVILTLGIGIFVKFAIDKEWINEIGRVAIGIAAGGILLGIAHWLREKYKAFSSVLVGGGLATLYFTLTIAYQQYHLFPQAVGFGMAIIITAFAIALSVLYDRKEIAILALLGGFSSPFLVAGNDGNYVALFTYLAILNVGITALAWFKNWRILNIIGYAGTILLFGGWIASEMWDGTTIPAGGGIFFALLFLTLFFLMNILHNLREGTKFGALQYLMLISNSGLFYGASMLILEDANLQLYQGLLTAGLGVFHFLFVFPLKLWTKVDRNLLILLIGLVLTFITLAVPIQLEGNYITLFWAAEAVLLLFLGQRTNIRLLKFASLVLSGLMVVSLGMDWQQLYFAEKAGDMNVILNPAMVSSIAGLASVIGMYFLLGREKMDLPIAGIRAEILQQVFFYLSIFTLYLTGVFEFSYQIYNYTHDTDLVGLIYGTYNAFFLAGLMLYARWKNIRFISQFVMGASLLVMVAYVIFHRGQIIHLRHDITLYGQSQLPFLFHYVFVLGFLGMLGLNLYHIRAKYTLKSTLGKIALWVTSAVVVFLASAELDHLFVLTRYDSVSEDILLEFSHKVGYAILWGVSAFTMIFLGMKFKHLHLRIAALVLFFLTLVKLFVYDIQDIPQGGKIAAFISLGVLLLVISFMYQRLKRLLLESESQAAKPGAEGLPQEEGEEMARSVATSADETEDSVSGQDRAMQTPPPPPTPPQNDEEVAAEEEEEEKK